MIEIKGEEELHGGFDCDTFWELHGGEEYLSFWPPRRDGYELEQRRFLAAMLKKTEPSTLLDFGCGPGVFFGLWAEVPIVCAYDRSKSMIEYASKLGYAYNLCAGTNDDPNRTGYANQKFDLIVAANVLAHVVNLPAMIEELHRISRGWMAIITAAEFVPTDPWIFNHGYNTALAPFFEVVEDYTSGCHRYMLVKRRIETP